MGGDVMTALAIASIVTGIVAVSTVYAGVKVQKGQNGTTATQKVLFFGGLFAAVWGTAFLLGSGQ
jgi:hypothetical protein